MPTATDKKAQPAKGKAPWWGEYAPETGEIISIAFGPSRVLIARQEHEWQVHAETPTEPHQEVRARLGKARSIPEDTKTRRFIFNKTEPKLSLMPALADRPVVTRPATALSIPPGMAVRLYVSSPLWLSADVHEKAVTLLDVPIFRPSDIWFGPDKLEGKLCYSSRTHARLDETKLLHRQHRAVTPVVIKNDDAETFELERISLPVPYLSIFAGANGEFWTDVVTLVRGKGGQSASLDIGGKMPKEAGAGKRLRGPREAKPSASLMKTIHEWLG